MARLHLIRHAQASFGMENYDQLSELGLKQSPYIPKHFDITPNVDAFYRGDMQRHRQTLEGSFTNADQLIIPGLNEFNHEEVLSIHRPEIKDKEKIMALVARQPDPKKFLEDEFGIAMKKWIHEEGESGYSEPFETFKTRALGALNQIITTARKEKHKEIVAITSGGYISFIITHVLGIPYEKMIDLNLGIVNTSVTTLLFNDRKISLSYYNNYSHLPKDMVTFI